jgi:hypothetical protein
MSDLMTADRKSFWRHKKEENFPPPPIRDSALYMAGSDRLCVSCTQTNLPAKQQARLVDGWCELLPTLTGIRLLWFPSQVPQKLFDAACRVPDLLGLHVWWSSIKDLSALQHAESLLYLHIGSSAQVQSIEPLRAMTQLQWLELENLQKIDDIAPLSGLHNLQGLMYAGSMNGKPTIQSLAPLADLHNLRWLALHSMRVTDGSLRPLGGLRDLAFLSLTNFYAVEEFAWLKTRLPHADYDIDAYTEINHSLVMLTGKRLGWLCRVCDAAKLDKAVARFKELERKYAQA